MSERLSEVQAISIKVEKFWGFLLLTALIFSCYFFSIKLNLTLMLFAQEVSCVIQALVALMGWQKDGL